MAVQSCAACAVSAIHSMTKKKRLPKAVRPTSGPRETGAVDARFPTARRVVAAVSGFLAANAVAVRFCLLFPVLLLLCWGALQREEVNRYLTLPFATLIATLAGGLLRLLHAGATLSGAVISGPGVSLIVVERCSTLFEMGIFLAALIAYPARPRAKLLGALVGVGCIFLLGIRAWWRCTTSAATRPASSSWHIFMSDNHSSSSLSSSSGSTGSSASPGRRPLLPDLLKFLGKFVLCYALALALWTLLLPGFMAVLTRVSGAIWPLVSPAGVGLRLDGLEIVAQTTRVVPAGGACGAAPVYFRAFLALVLATSGLGVERRFADRHRPADPLRRLCPGDALAGGLPGRVVSQLQAAGDE